MKFTIDGQRTETVEAIEGGIMDSLEVGRVGEDVFVGCTTGYEKCNKPFSGKPIHTLRFSPADAEWLITAIAKELHPDALPRAIKSIEELIEESNAARQPGEGGTEGQQTPHNYGCHCQECGRVYIGDLLVPDDVWNRVAAGDREELLCPTCLTNRIVRAGIWAAARATDVDATEHHRRRPQPGEGA